MGVWRININSLLTVIINKTNVSNAESNYLKDYYIVVSTLEMISLDTHTNNCVKRILNNRVN